MFQNNNLKIVSHLGFFVCLFIFLNNANTVLVLADNSLYFPRLYKTGSVLS